MLSWLTVLGVGGENGLLPLLPELAADLELTSGPGLAGLELVGEPGRLATGDLPGMGAWDAGPGWLPGLTGVTCWSAEGSWVGGSGRPRVQAGSPALWPVPKQVRHTFKSNSNSNSNSK